MSSLISYKQTGVTQSPFVLIFSEMGIPFAADIMNFVVLTAIILAANSGLYASTRMLWSLANEGIIPKIFKQTNRKEIPIYALIASMIGGVFALFSTVYAAGSVYLVLVSISGLAVVFVWMAIALSELQFRKHYVASGKDVRDLVYRTPFYPWTPLAAFILCFLSCILIWFDSNQRVALLHRSICCNLLCFYEIKIRYDKK